MEQSDSLLTNDVALEIGTSGASVRLYADKGLLHAERTARGVRIFKRSEVERFIAERESKRQAVAS